ncbi:LamG-like jellyroll fold domain-containing protein [uncultured Jatrophihabitans sp.]|uniref:LamG-like jellyroll fold domain-containing protein n=1 Tax=uncultured Jatrophihabitans sp. TaxID=1610747 RepID=UPI0035CB6A80
MHSALRTGTFRRLSAAVAAVLAVITMLVAVAGLAAAGRPAGADTNPASGLPTTVSADGLPTAQINGVAWAQVVVGNTVYVTGSFSQARPAGVKVGGAGTVARSNLLAYNLTTGALISTFNHTLTATGYSIAASPDGSMIYVGGAFTTVDGASHPYLAAFTTSSGALVTGFKPTFNNTVRALAVSSSTLYAGGAFTAVSGVARSRLAALNRTTGAVTAWNPGVNATVQALTLPAGSGRLVAGGYFTTMAGKAAIGMGSVDATSGASEPWAANSVIQDSGSSAAIYSLTSDASKVYGTGYFYTTGGNFEGRFAATPSSGAISWLNNCHGDSYSVAAIGTVLYSAGHEHDCSDIGAFSQDNPSPTASTHHFLAAEMTTPNGGVDRKPLYPGGAPGPTYHDFSGQPTSTQLDWYPTLTEGTYTGQYQAAWTVTGNSTYLVVGGEFPTVNGAAQQGLVRFAVPSKAPNKVGPTKATSLTPVVVSQRSGTARIAWQATWDEDNTALTYKLYRDSSTTPISTQTLDSTFWNRPALGYLDKGLTAGSTHTYKVVVTDPRGNALTSGTTSVVIGSATPGTYAARVAADGATDFWPLGEASGATSFDHTGYADLALTGGYTRSASGGPAGGGATALAGGETTPPQQTGKPPPQPVPNDTVGTVATAAPASLPAFSLEVWFKASAGKGGALIDDGLYPSADSAAIDRAIYLDDTGGIHFGVQNNTAVQTIGGGAGYNDGAWHLATATFGSAGAAVYVDGALVKSTASMTDDIIFPGHWRVGGDSLRNWPSAPSNNYLAGSVADAAVYPTQLSAATVAAHYAAAG